MRGLPVSLDVTPRTEELAESGVSFLFYGSFKKRHQNLFVENMSMISADVRKGLVRMKGAITTPRGVW